MIIIKITKRNEQLDKEPIKKRAIIKQGAFYYITINVQNYFQLISSYKIPMQKEKTLTQILV